MWDRVKHWLADRGLAARGPGKGALRWYDPGPENPFGIRVLGCRPLTWNLVSTTGDPAIAASYVRLRKTDGRELIDQAIKDAVRLPVSLEFPHDGARLEGIVCKSDSMEVKWDIYIYDSVFLFARSWTGEPLHRAWATVGSTAIRVTQIECSQGNRDLAAEHVYFLIASHAMKRVLSHCVPCEPSADPTQIATLSFALFGRLGCYAAFEDITRLPIEFDGRRDRR
ncbi:MAG: hypothetical protein HY700_20130 [Gemmatimonadetes bacterium]|nr:hypothetical protein [Gemmatimonadota bacterium]